MPHLDLTVTLGNLVEMGGIVVALFGLYKGLVVQLVEFRATLGVHAKEIATHGARLEKYESGMFSVVRDLGQVMGRLETITERRAHPRS